ncbi:hypothetical protein, partial [Mesorhizobium sp.]|uniref:hypothetical protein n=1 Tax=Mesorhizobium sp. TaxID=1871066 RepID=UPI00257B0501
NLTDRDHSRKVVRKHRLPKGYAGERRRSAGLSGPPPIGPRRAIGSIDPSDTALVETEHSILSALLLKVGKQIIPCTQEFATVVANDPVLGTGVGRNPQPYCQAIRALQLVVKILFGH